MLHALAPAKINLALHIIARREDGYHELDSLVQFADIGDKLGITAHQGYQLSVTGPFAQGVPTDASNLITQTVNLLASESGNAPNITITLEKNIPTGAGLGGGSADAAAIAKLLVQFWNLNMPLKELAKLLLPLGADIPACLLGRSLQMTGIGERVYTIDLPQHHAVLVYPAQHVATAEVYKSLDPHDFTGSTGNKYDIARLKNDLELPARSIAPVINQTISALEHSPECQLARMSGSGSACFGLYPTARHAQLAADILASSHPDWWVKAAVLR